VRASVIVIDWHQPELTRRALDAIAAQRTAYEYDVVLVVNEASDTDVAAYVADYPSVRVVAERTNAGFAGGMVRGVAASTGDVLVLVNNDAVPDNGFLERGLAMLDALGPGVGALAATVVLEGGFARADGAPCDDDMVAPDGGRWRRVGGESSLQTGQATTTVGEPLVNGTGVVVDATGNGRDRDWLAPLDGGREQAVLFGFSGGAAFIRREALDAAGGFDPELFMYYEDVDVSWRMRLAGYDIRHVPDAVVVHRHAASSGSDSDLVRYQSMRNRLAVVARDASESMARRVLVRTVVRGLVDMVRPGAAQLSRAEWLRLAREAPRMIRRARRLRRLDRVRDARRREIEAAYLSR
jgi:GT2 family glycosyltransferase